MYQIVVPDSIIYLKPTATLTVWIIAEKKSIWTTLNSHSKLNKFYLRQISNKHAH